MKLAISAIGIALGAYLVNGAAVSAVAGCNADK